MKGSLQVYDSDTYLQIQARIDDKEYRIDDKVLFCESGENYNRSQ